MEVIGRINEVQYHALRSYNFEWQIPEFAPSDLPDDISSPTFSFAGAFWCLRMYLNCQRKGDIGFGMNDDIGLFLRRKSSGSPISLDFSLSLKTKDGGEYQKVHRSHIFREAEKEFGVPSWIAYEGIEFSRSTGLLPSNSLTVLCTLRYFESEAEEDESKSYVSYICGFLLLRIIR